MKKSAIIILCLLSVASAARAFQMQSQRELGRGEAKNQNVIVKCTTPDGKMSGQTCALRRFAKCNDKKVCNGWQEWKDLRNPRNSYGDWRAAAADCCAAKGLR
ncbi:MAG: hypothetical protein LBT45_02985 [Rickettsiales bacterium]|jgi:hypothetical protein|nr:hypothetical protein [Rickettsiales bacterium]